LYNFHHFITLCHVQSFFSFFSQKENMFLFIKLCLNAMMLIFRSYEMKLIFHYSVKWAISQTHKISSTHLHSKVINMEDKVFVQVFFTSPYNSTNDSIKTRSRSYLWPVTFKLFTNRSLKSYYSSGHRKLTVKSPLLEI